jgi:hypothetical protein
MNSKLPSATPPVSHRACDTERACADTSTRDDTYERRPKTCSIGTPPVHRSIDRSHWCDFVLRTPGNSTAARTLLPPVTLQLDGQAATTCLPHLPFHGTDRLTLISCLPSMEALQAAASNHNHFPSTEEYAASMAIAIYACTALSWL